MASAGREPWRGPGARYGDGPASSEFLSRGARRRVLSFVRAVFRGPGGCECVGGRRRQRSSAARRREAARSRRAFKNTTGLFALAAASPRLRSRREAASRSRASWTLSAHGATMAAIVYDELKRLAFPALRVIDNPV